jgi:predicted Rossmann fold nucleotide-binding protein DprA/Smf involved in DNA uptake
LQLNPQERQVLQAISADPIRVEQVAADSHLSLERVLATLCVLEMRRLVWRVSGDRVARLYDQSEHTMRHDARRTPR